MKNILPKEFKAYPSVFAVEDTYQIIIPAKKELLMWIKVGNEEFFDDTNGILRSSSPIHKISIPKAVLDESKQYTVCFRQVKKRKAYCTKTYEKKEYTYSFKPFQSGKSIKIFHISDSHDRFKLAVECAKKAGDFDLLILNGDIARHSGAVKYIEIIYLISGGASMGQIPCVFSRGNHDLRGKCAEHLASYTPEYFGKSYYTFSLGDLWGMVLDCGEDKDDSDIEYGNTVCCHNFRQLETKFIEAVIEKGEYSNEKYRHKIVVAHAPFTHKFDAPEKFMIENDIYMHWSKIINDKIKPDFYLYGHTHKTEIVTKESEYEIRVQDAPAIIGGKPKSLDEKSDGCTGTLITLTNPVSLEFIDNLGSRQKHTI